ncbi:endolysin [Lactobacillus selangorensis]|uniref:Endolysin n=1 Tax=Lactobacillus selangorensis TaxID=81857 RepID=A0A0R2FLP5_9LACO|nr:endolysin [Lactobacillus selangorensis]
MFALGLTAVLGLNIGRGQVHADVYPGNDHGTLVADISSYQSSDLSFFQTLANRGVKGVVVKLTEGSADGTAYVNPKAGTQIKNAQAAGLNVSLYHFGDFYGDADAIAEAKWFVAYAQKYGLSKSTVMVDDKETRATGESAAHLTSSINAFDNYLKSQGYSNTALYTMRSWFTDGIINVNDITVDHFWIADYSDQLYYNNSKIDMWQYTSSYNWDGTGQNNIDMSLDYTQYFTNQQNGDSSNSGSSSVSALTNKQSANAVETVYNQKGAVTYDSNGASHQTLSYKSAWKVNGTAQDASGSTYYLVGADLYIKAQDTVPTVATINSGVPTKLWKTAGFITPNGQTVANGSAWKIIKTIRYNNGETWYDLGSGQWVSALYVSVK